MTESDNLAQPASAGDKGFIAQVLAGDFGLANAYWLLGVIGGGLLSLPIVIFAEALERPKIAAILFVAYLIYIVPVLVGIWNAAGKYKGRKLWAVLARVAVVIGALKILTVLLVLPKAFA
jgi:hypothetical protein